jgi:anti-anti-sigma regulatory factor
MKAGDINLREMLNFKPGTGEVLFGRNRMVIANADSFGLLRKELVSSLGMDRARGIIKRFGYLSGYSDAEMIKANFQPDSEEDWIASGAALHVWEGIAHAKIERLDFNRDEGRFFLSAYWDNSYEVEQHLKHFGMSESPVCWYSVGYISGYCTKFFKRRVIGKEIKCVGCGDERCYIVLKTQEEWDEKEIATELEDYQEARIDLEMKEKDELIRMLKEQQKAIQELSTPVLQVTSHILVLPLIGIVDTTRAQQIVEQLLNKIVETQASIVILDVTGVPVIDSAVANHLIQTVQAAKLLGATTILTGISTVNAQTIVSLGIDLSEIITCNTLRAGIKKAYQMLGVKPRETK